ncbi:hypothetical protein DVA67_024710 [Solirubrobacter sp. CPCC 204708]|uniref:Uncharacterized protein n=1 Tax=Solirubrobacter deserti TaxID=2282478 RepID=A0ABT4RNW3_9ACTN|nr:hypothetical protein [Solirubrobacter deserti]MBE2319201.1 hypothetical protein [Solirubrobacter deserti]MDA0140207.1 hypothetical protein [Solirubrobacter deserti]
MIETLFPPVPADDEVERAAREKGLAALREAAADEARRSRAGTASGAAASGPRRRGVRRRSWLVLPAVAAVAAGVFALTSGVDEGRVSPPPASAAQLLSRAADAAATAPAPGAIGPGEHFYVRRTAMEPKTIERGGERFTVFIRSVDEDWTARRVRAQPAPARGAGVPGAARPGRVGASGRAEPARDDRQLPADPRRRGRHLSRSAAAGVPGALGVGDVLPAGACAAH